MKRGGGCVICMADDVFPITATDKAVGCGIYKELQIYNQFSAFAIRYSPINSAFSHDYSPEKSEKCLIFR